MKVSDTTFLKKAGKEFCLIPTHVDDLFAFYSPGGEKFRDELVLILGKRITLKSLGKTTRMLSVQLLDYRMKGELHLSQSDYIQEFLERFNFTSVRVRQTPTKSSGNPEGETVEPLCKARKPAEIQVHDPTPIDQPVKQATGCLNWILMTRLDCTRALRFIQKLVDKSPKHAWQRIIWLAGYLRGTIEMH
jgi:hypothetical protein